jgi:hypothetical protein
MTMKIPKVLDCSISDCAYNSQKACHAMAITIGEAPSDPICDTYFHSDVHGGIKDMTANVGACKTSACTYNHDFECTAADIHVGMKGRQPDCLTFQGR